MSRPSETIAAEAFPWYALIPRIFISRFASVPQGGSLCGEMSAAPLVQDIQGPGARPGGFPGKKIRPHRANHTRAKINRQRRLGVAAARLHAPTPWARQPRLHGQN